MTLAQTNPDQVRAHVESICQSAGFARSEALCKLLRTIVEESLAGRPESLKESVLSHELYRDKKYDSRLDSRVRVDASNLRARLAKYYATAGVGSEIRIEIPKGAYVAVFHRQDLPPAGRPPRKATKLLLAGVLGFLPVLWWVTRMPGPHQVKLPVQLTYDSGFSGELSVSRDGRIMAYASDRGPDGVVHIWIKDGDAPPRQLTNGPGHDFRPTLSADSQYVAYRSNRPGADGIYVVSARGGPTRLIATGGYAPRFAPKGHALVYAGRDPDSAVHVYVADIDRNVPPRQIDSGTDNSSCPIWTPDGTHIVFAAQDTREEWDYWIAPVNPSARVLSRRLGIQASLRQLGLPVIKDPNECPQDWLGNRLLFITHPPDRVAGIVLETQLSAPNWSPTSIQLFQPSIPTGIVRVASETHALFYGIERSARAIWTLNLEPNRPSQLTKAAEDVSIHGGFRGTWSSLSGNGYQLCWVTERTGRPDILCRDSVRGAERLLGAQPQPRGSLVLDRAGQRLAYLRRNGDQENLVVREIATGAERQILERCTVLLQWLPNDEHLLCSEPNPPRGNILHLVPIHSQYPRELLKLDQPLMHAQLSPDTHWAAVVVDSGQNGLVSAYLAPMSGESSDRKRWIKILDEPFQAHLHWSPDGNAVYFWQVRDGFRCLWCQRLNPVTKQPIGEPIAILHRRGYQAYPTGSGGLAISGLAPPRFAMTLSDLLSNIWRMEVK